VLEILGQGFLSDFLGDAVVYRNLTPIDRRLPGLEELRELLGLPVSGIPRKVEPAYGRVVVEILRAANRQVAGSGDPTSVILIGDTEHNDGGAFRNICATLACPGGAFICDEDSNPAHLDAATDGSRRVVYLANRWSLVGQFEHELVRAGIEIGHGTAVLLDIDKTALGARGRNDQPIDAARVAAVMKTANEIIGEKADHDLILAAYHRFNQPIFHSFTTDNQDCLAYLALIVGSGWRSVDALEREIIEGQLPSFEMLLERVSAEENRLSGEIRSVHRRVLEAVAVADPTPFKDFRRAEFHETVARMVPSDDSPAVVDLIGSKITITAEVRTKALEWRDRGALILGLSDKPDEASCPDDAESSGMPPLHRAPAYIVGQAPSR
jgi:hypothetical protein